MWSFQGPWFFTLEFPRGVTWNFQWWSFVVLVWNFQESKVDKPRNSRGFSKVCLQPPIWIFSGSSIKTCWVYSVWLVLAVYIFHIWIAGLWVPLPHSHGQICSHSDWLHDFPVTIFRSRCCYKNVYVNCFLAELWACLDSGIILCLQNACFLWPVTQITLI